MQVKNLLEINNQNYFIIKPDLNLKEFILKCQRSHLIVQNFIKLNNISQQKIPQGFAKGDLIFL